VALVAEWLVAAIIVLMCMPFLGPAIYGYLAGLVRRLRKR